MRGSLTEAPVSYLRWMAAASIAMAVGGLLAPVVVMVTAGLGQGVAAKVVGTFAMAGAAAWTGGVWIYSRPRPVMPGSRTDPARELRWVRWLTRAGQSLWLPAAGLTVHAEAWSGWTPASALVVIGLVLAGFIGTIPLSIWLGEIAHWANHTGLAAWGQTAAWAIIVGGALALTSFVVAPLFGPLALVFRIVGVLSGLLLVLAMLLLVGSLFGNAGMCLWALRCSRAALDRAWRAAAREEREAASLGKPPEEPASALATPAEAGGEIYELEPEPRDGGDRH